MPWLASCARVLQRGCGQPGVLGGFTPAGGAKSSCRGATAPQGLASSARSFIAPTMTPEPIWRAPQRFAPVRGAGWRLAVRVVARVEADQTANVSADLAHHLLLREHAPTTHAGLFARSTAVCRLRARAARRSGAWGKGARSPSPRHPRAAWTALFPRATPASVDATVPTSNQRQCSFCRFGRVWRRQRPLRASCRWARRMRSSRWTAWWTQAAAE